VISAPITTSGQGSRRGPVMKKRYVQVGLIIAALALGIAVVSVFAGFDAFSVEQADHTGAS